MRTSLSQNISGIPGDGGVGVADGIVKLSSEVLDRVAGQEDMKTIHMIDT